MLCNVWEEAKYQPDICRVTHGIHTEIC
jgi:hypothetical protein